MEALENRVEALENRVEALENRMESLESRVESLENRIESLESNVKLLENRIGFLEVRVDGLDGKAVSIEKRLSIVESVVTDARRENRLVRSIVENEINYNIGLIAEGHCDLNRKVDDAIHTASGVAAKEEVYDVKFVIQGEKIRELAERMDIYAAN